MAAVAALVCLGSCCVTATLDDSELAVVDLGAEGHEPASGKEAAPREEAEDDSSQGARSVLIAL